MDEEQPPDAAARPRPPDDAAPSRDAKAAASRVWREANLERSRQLNRDSARRVAAARQALDRKRQRSRQKYAENRGDIRERARRARAEHPERDREYQRRYRDRNPEAYAESRRRSAHRWRDTHADQARAASREAGRIWRDQHPDGFRDYYQANIERLRERSRTYNRLRARLKALGLPPRHVHRVFSEQKRAQQAAADAFFQTRRSKPQIADLLVEKSPIPHAVLARIEARRGLLARGATDEEITALRTELHALRQVDAWREQLPTLIGDYARTHRDRILADITLDSRARIAHGHSPHDTNAELVRRIRVECFPTVARQLLRTPDTDALHRLRDLIVGTADNTTAHPLPHAAVPGHGTAWNEAFTASTRTRGSRMG